MEDWQVQPFQITAAAMTSQAKRPSHIQKTSFCWLFSHPLTLALSFAHSSKMSPDPLRGWYSYSLGAEHAAIMYSLDSGQLWIPALTAAHCREKLLRYGYNSEWNSVVTDFHFCVCSCLPCLCVHYTLTEELTLEHRLKHPFLSVLLSRGTTHQADSSCQALTRLWATVFRLTWFQYWSQQQSFVPVFWGLLATSTPVAHSLMLSLSFECLACDLFGSAFQSFCGWVKKGFVAFTVCGWYLLLIWRKAWHLSDVPFLLPSRLPSLSWCFGHTGLFGVTPRGFNVVLFCYFILWVCWVVVGSLLGTFFIVVVLMTAHCFQYF